MSIKLIIRLESTVSKMQAKIYRDSEWNEYRTKFYNADGQYIVGADSHCDDRDEAIDTAKAVLAHYNF